MDRRRPKNKLLIQRRIKRVKPILEAEMPLDKSTASNLSGQRGILGVLARIRDSRLFMGISSFCLAVRPRSCLAPFWIAYLIRLR